MDSKYQQNNDDLLSDLEEEKDAIYDDDLLEAEDNEAAEVVQATSYHNSASKFNVESNQRNPPKQVQQMPKLNLPSSTNNTRVLKPSPQSSQTQQQKQHKFGLGAGNQNPAPANRQPVPASKTKPIETQPQRLSGVYSNKKSNLASP